MVTQINIQIQVLPEVFMGHLGLSENAASALSTKLPMGFF